MVQRFGLTRAPLLGAVLALAALLLAASPSPAAVTFGDPLTSAGTPQPCYQDHIAPCTIVIGKVPTSADPMKAPMDGVIVRWRLRDSVGSSFRLRVARLGTGGAQTFISTSAPGTGAPAGIATFSTRQPVKAGDFIGVSWDGTAGLGGIENASGSIYTFYDDVPADGATVTGAFVQNKLEPLFNADIEPDADGDGFGDETQDQCPGCGSTPSPPAQPSTPGTPTSGFPTVKLILQSPVATNPDTGRGTIQMQCTNVAGDVCKVKFVLQMETTSHKARAASKTRTVDIGTVAGTIPGGKTGSLALKLNRKGRSLLQHQRTLKAKLVGTSSNRAGTATKISKPVTLKAKKKKRH